MVAQFLDRKVGHFLALVEHPKTKVVCGLADDGEVETPFDEDGFRLVLLGRLENHEHALLAFRQHHLVGAHVLFAHRHLVEIEFDSEIAFGAHFDRRAGQPRGTHVLDGDDGAGLHEFEAGFEQAFFGERVADLNGGTLFLDRVVELGRRHGSAADAVTAGLGAEIDDGQADALGFGEEDRVGLCETCGKGVDEAVAVITGVEFHFAADGRHAERIAVTADTGNDTGHEMAGLGMVRCTEAKRVHRRNRSRAHSEHVAQNAADPGRSPLIGLDIGGVVVALHLKDHAVAVADIDHAGILAGAVDHVRPGGRKRTEPLL